MSRVHHSNFQKRAPKGHPIGGQWVDENKVINSARKAAGVGPADAVDFSGSLYHNTSPKAAERIEEEGFKIGEKTRIKDGVYFWTSLPEDLGQPEPGEAFEDFKGGATIRVDLSGAKLAPSADKIISLQDQFYQQAKEQASHFEFGSPEFLRIRDETTIFKKAREAFNSLGYDGYEQGWHVVVITNLDLLKDPRRIR